jgi:hypothetical protein
MRSLVSFLVLVLLAGCGSLKACGGSAPVATASATPTAPTALAAAPAPPAPPKPPEPPEARFAQRYLVIAHTSPNAGEGEDIIEKLRTAGLGEGVERVSTTPFSSLRPCLEVVVAGAFADKAAAEERSRRLAAAGVDNYLRNTGALVQDREARESECQQLAEARRNGALRARPPEGPFLVESRGERTFLLLVSGGSMSFPGPELDQVGDDRRFWLAPLKEDPTGVLAKGARFNVYDASGTRKEGCRVKGFALLHRGRPHFSYFQREEPQGPPDCGGTWPVAELDCPVAGAGDSDSENVVFALAADRPAPRFFQRSGELAAHVRHAQESALRALPEYETARENGQAHAKEQQEPLQEKLELRVYPLEGRQLVVGLAHLQTGEGHWFCGGEDFWASLSRVVAVSPDEQETPVGGGVDGDDIVGVVDLEGDGQVELLTRRGDAVSILTEDGAERASSDVPNCDCGC